MSDIIYRVHHSNQEEANIIQKLLFLKDYQWDERGKTIIDRFSDGYNYITVWNDGYLSLGNRPDNCDISFDQFLDKMEEELR